MQHIMHIKNNKLNFYVHKQKIKMCFAILNSLKLIRVS